jgi:hypothetical protein
MKCLGCGTDNDFRTRERTGGVCDVCGRRFVFEPRRGDPVADPSFQNALDVVSEGGRLAWLEDQLYYEMARRARKRRFLHRVTRRARVSIERSDFDELLARWITQYGRPEGRLPAQAFATAGHTEERDRSAADHPYERLLVCSSDAVVDFLLANGFHGDHRCVVLSASGYPGWARTALLPGLRAAPPQTIAVVHDADVAGCSLAAMVRDSPDWFGGVENVTVVDGGLRPLHARRFRGLCRPAPALRMPVDLPRADARWLARHRLELTAVRPRSLLGIIAGIVSGVEEQQDGGQVSVAPIGVDAWGDGGGDGGDDGVG